MDSSNNTTRQPAFTKDFQYKKFCAYGFLKNLRFYEPFFMLFFLEKGLGFLQIGVLYAVKEIGVNIFEIPSGIFADSLGRKRTMLISFLAYIVSFLGFYFFRGFAFLFIPMLFYSVGDAFRTGTHKAMIFDYLKQNNWGHLRTDYYGHTRSWSQKGAAVSALIAGFLVFRRGSYAPIFLFTIIPYTLDFLLILSYPGSLDGPGSSKHKKGFVLVFRDLVSSFKHPELMKGISQQALYSGFYKGCKDFLQPLLQSMALGLPIFLALADQERTAILSGVLYSGLYFLTSYASRKSGTFSGMFQDISTPLNRTLLIGAGFGAAAGTAYILGIPTVAVFLYVGIYVIENLRKPIGIDYVSQRMNQQSMASALSVESQAETLFSAGFALFLGFLVHILGLGVGILLVSILVAGLGWIIRLKPSGA